MIYKNTIVSELKVQMNNKDTLRYNGIKQKNRHINETI